MLYQNIYLLFFAPWAFPDSNSLKARLNILKTSHQLEPRFFYVFAKETPPDNLIYRKWTITYISQRKRRKEQKKPEFIGMQTYARYKLIQ